MNEKNVQALKAGRFFAMSMSRPVKTLKNSSLQAIKHSTMTSLRTGVRTAKTKAWQGLQMDKLGYIPTECEPPSWGTNEPGNKIRRHKNNNYLLVHTSKNTRIITNYEVDGVKYSKQEFIEKFGNELLKSEKEGGEYEAGVITVKLNNIDEIK